jgi:multidrug efflux system membrane fusion protein
MGVYRYESNCGIYSKKSLLILPVAAGIFIFVFMKTCAPGPQAEPIIETETKVRAINVVEYDLIPKAVGYGTVEPAVQWQSLSKVQGDVVWSHPRLKVGEVIFEPTTVLRIDSTEYELIIRQLEAELAQKKSQLAELETSANNTNLLLVIEKENLALSEKELQRKKILYEKGNLSASEFEREQRAVSNQRVKVQQLENSLNIFPNQKATALAQIEVTKAKLEQAKNDLGDTTIELPFPARINEAPIEKGEYVSYGTLMIEAYAIDSVELMTEVPVASFRKMFSNQSFDMEEALKGKDQSEVFASLGFTAKVQLDVGSEQITWDATVERIRGLIHPKTRTLGVVVAVADPFHRLNPGTRPPLVPGMFCKVTLFGPAHADSVVIPRNAWHNGTVYVADSESRLRRNKAVLEYYQEDLAILSGGISAGDRVIVSDLVPAIDGMKLIVEDDEELQTSIQHKAMNIPSGVE